MRYQSLQYSRGLLFDTFGEPVDIKAQLFGSVAYAFVFEQTVPVDQLYPALAGIDVSQSIPDSVVHHRQAGH